MLNSQCVEGARDGIDIRYMRIIRAIFSNSQNSIYKKATVAWIICGINAFVMMCSGLVIDIGDLYKNYLRSHIRWPVIVGKLFPCMGFLYLGDHKIDKIGYYVRTYCEIIWCGVTLVIDR